MHLFAQTDFDFVYYFTSAQINKILAQYTSRLLYFRIIG